jgi:outer membrane protein insertion porin family
VNYNVTEQPSAEIRGGVGYSELDKFMITAGLNQKNWFGTGNALGLDVQLSKPVISADVSYYNPYFTKSGIGRSIDVYATRNNLEKENIADYAIDSYGATVGFNFPITAKDSVQAGVGIERNMLKQGAQTFQILSDFVKDHGTKFTQVLLNAGWSHQGFDRSIFPTNGLYESLGGTVSVPVSNSSLEYYKVGYGATYYNSIYRDFIGQARFHAGYGNGYGRYKNDLPFFKNYFAGGMGSQDGSGTVRGYEGNSLGPKNELGDSMGGKFEINGTLGLVFPTPLGKNVRTTVFVDGGNVYNSFSVKNIRYSAGLAVDWLSPIALLNFSIAEPLNAKPEDNKEIFQFNIGTSF